MEDIFEHLRMILEGMYQNGKTDQEIADLLGCSQSQINHLRNGKRSFAKMRLETLLRLFPNMRITLDGMATAATDEEAAELLGLFRTLNSAGRAALLGTARSLAIQPALSNSPSPAPSKAE